MNDKGIIRPDDISSLTTNLKLLGLDGVSHEVEQLYLKYKSKDSSTPSSLKPPNELEIKMQILITELKNKYEELCRRVQPIPYIRDRMYCVDRVYVEGGIEVLALEGAGIEGHENWEGLESYRQILRDTRTKSKRRIVEGEPGFGKSTLTLQLAYDWCKHELDSPLSNVSLLIILRLRQLGGVNSISRAIKQFLLPRDSKINENDIQQILYNKGSILIVLDGFDEYPDQDCGRETDIISIIKNDMFQQIDVILTTRSACLPKEYPPQTKRIKLTGFDFKAREQYIRKAVVRHGDNDEVAKEINYQLQGNPILADLCQVPLFFVMFAHMSYERRLSQKFDSVTSFFRYMISCFHSHMRNKITGDENLKKFELFQRDHKELDLVAFNGLSGSDQQLSWKMSYICQRLGQEFYDQYVRIGILIEEEVLDINDEPGTSVYDHIKYNTEVRFYHKLLCEWYAAHHLVTSYGKTEPAQDSEIKNFISLLQKIDPFDLQYVFRFACGLNTSAAEVIINYLKTKGDADMFAILCILEQSGKVENILKTVKELCKKKIEFSNKETMLLQRSTIQLLQIASCNNVPISSVKLRDCFSLVDLSSKSLLLQSGIQLPALNTLRRIEIAERGRIMTDGETTDILEYSAMCQGLETLRLWFCLLPRYTQSEYLHVLRSRNVEVLWDFGYRLNLQSCEWEHDDEDRVPMTDEDYEERVAYIRRFKRPTRD